MLNLETPPAGASPVTWRAMGAGAAVRVASSAPQARPVAVQVRTVRGRGDERVAGGLGGPHGSSKQI